MSAGTEKNMAEIAIIGAGNSSDNGTDLIIGIPLERKIIYQAVAVTLSLMVVYVTFALLQYNWLKSDCLQPQERSSSMKREGTARRRGGKDSGGTSDSSNSTTHRSCRSKSTAALNAKILRYMCVIASVFTFIRILSEQMELLPPNDARLNCRDYQIAMVITYCFAITMLYGILWYRVRVFLSHPAMRHLGSKVLTVLAFVVLFIMVLASGTNAAMFLVTTISREETGGCAVVSPGNTLSNSARFAILTVCTVISQASLLGLFLYPLVRHSATMRGRKINTPATSRRAENESVKTGKGGSFKGTLSPGTLTRTLTRGRNTTRRQKREQALLKIIRRVMITAIVCAVSDIFCGLIVRLVIEEPRIVTNLVFDANLVVNLACVLMSFKDWRVRMFPCCAKHRKPQPSEKQTPHRPSSSRDRKLKLIEQRVPSSPAGFTSRESTTQGIYHTSESGIHSPSPREDDSQDLDKEDSREMTATTDDTVHGKSA